MPKKFSAFGLWRRQPEGHAAVVDRLADHGSPASPRPAAVPGEFRDKEVLSHALSNCFSISLRGSISDDLVANTCWTNSLQAVEKNMNV
jgi:hypothetical protein